MVLFDYKPEESIGKVYSVDTGTVTVRIVNIDQLRRLQVNHLVVLESSNVGQHLIGLIAKIMRKSLAGPIDEASTEELPEGVVVEENVIRVILIGTLVDKEGTRLNRFKRTLESVPEIDANCFVLEGTHLTEFMGAISKSKEEGSLSLTLGKYTLDENAEAWLDGNRFFQRHAVVVGSTGSGKSWAVAHILEQLATLPSANAILFDIHGEYEPIKGKGIQHLRVAGPSDLDKGKGLRENILFLPFWLLTYEEMLALLLDRSDQNAPNQAMLFSRAVTDAKLKTLKVWKQPDLEANFTIDSPIPYDLAEVLVELNRLNTERVPGARTGDTKAGDFAGKLGRFIQRLEAKMNDRRMGFLFKGSEDVMKQDWMLDCCNRLVGCTSCQVAGGVKIIDFSEVPSDVLPLIIGLVARVIFTIQQWSEKDQRHPIALFCDEAHLYVPERVSSNEISAAGLSVFERIAKEGRKYGVGLVVISQRPAEVNRTVLSQCNNFVAMRLTNAEDQSVVRRLMPDTLGGFADLLPILDIGEALVVGDASLLPSRIRIEAPKLRPTSGTVDFWSEWSEERAVQGIALAVESLRRQAKR